VTPRRSRRSGRSDESCGRRNTRSLAAAALVLAVACVVPAAAVAQPLGGHPGLDAYTENPRTADALRSVPGSAGSTAPRVGSAEITRRKGGQFLKGYAEEEQFVANDPDRTFWWDQAVRANIDIARINIRWSAVAPSRPANPTDPGDPAYQWGNFDAAVREAAARGLRVVLTLHHSPDWAEAGQRPDPGEYPRGTWKPDPVAFGEFGQAVATRYSGTFVPLGTLTPLPRVDFLTAWNEPNLTDYITPQSVNGKLFAADHYRRMVNAFSDGVAASANPGAQIVAGATSPYGDDIGGRRTRPLQFFRDFLCLKGDLSAQKNCPGGKADFDVLAHHPITFEKNPGYSARHRDDVAMADFKNVVKTLRAAEKRNTVTGGRHQAWATEYWWESDPPDPGQGVPIAKHARWVQEALYSLWRQGASAAIWFQIVDGPDSHPLQSGHFFRDRTEKPAFTAFRFPFVADRLSKKKVRVWTIAPADGSVEIQERRGDGFQTIRRMAVADGVPKQTTIKLRGKPTLRGVLGGEASIASKPG
jgi:hypothetical protein